MFDINKTFWVPGPEELLIHFPRTGHKLDIFAIKMCQKENYKTVGHLPMESSRETKFTFDKVAKSNSKSQQNRSSKA